MSDKNRNVKTAEDILDALKAAQVGKGYLSEEDIIKVAAEYGKYPSEVYETATFYTMLHVGGNAEHVIEICGSTCCDAGNAAELVRALEAELGIKCGSMTEDGKWLLRRCECLGRCDTAPNAMVDGVLLTNAKADDVITMIRKAGK